MRRTVALLSIVAGCGIVAVGAPAALADLPPPSSADAIVAQVDGLLGVSHTHAEAGPTGGIATGNVLELGGNPPAPQFGGTQSGPGSTGNVLLDTGDTPLGRLQLTPWDASVTSPGGSTTSQGDASVAKLSLLPQLGTPLVTFDLLGSSSTATWNPDVSTAHAVANGASLSLADQLELIILHSETDSSTPGTSALLVLNDMPIGTGDQLGALCNLDLPPLLKLICLTAAGGNGTPSVSDVLSGTLLGNDQLSANVAGTTSSGGSSTSDNGGNGGNGNGGGNTGGSTGVEANQFTNGAGGQAAQAPLARTGAGIGRELAIALALVSLGVAIAGLGRARRILLVP